MANLGHGRFQQPFTFFEPPQLPADAVVEDEHDGGLFVDLQRQAGLAACAIAIATSSVSAQVTAGWFEEVPAVVASTGPQRLILSPTQNESYRTRYSYAAEELSVVVPSINVDDNGQWTFTQTLVEVPNQPLSSTEEVSPFIPSINVDDDGWSPGVVAAPDARQPSLADEEMAPPPPIAISGQDDPWFLGTVAVPSAIQPFSTTEERSIAPTVSPGISKQFVISPTAKQVIQLRYFNPSEEIGPQANVINVDDIGEPTFDRQIDVSPVPQVFAADEEHVDQVPTINVDDVPDVTYQQQIPQQVPPTLFSSDEDRVQVISASDETGVIPRGPTDPEYLLPAPWINGGEGVQWGIFEEDGYWPFVSARPTPFSFIASDDTGLIPPPSINVDDISAPAYAAQIAVWLPPQVFTTDEDRVVPPATIGVDDVAQPTYDRQILLTVPPRVFSADEDRPLTVAVINVDDTPRVVYDRRIAVGPVPFLFTATEEIVARPAPDVEGFVPKPTQIQIIPPGAFTYEEEVSVATGATTRYIVGSSINTKIRLATVWRWTLKLSKTSAGTVGSSFIVKLGTSGAVNDASILTFTLPVGTAIADDAEVMIAVTVRGPLGVSCIAQGYLRMVHNLAADGFATIPAVVMKITSAPFVSSYPNLIAGLACTIISPTVLTFEQVITEDLKP